MLIWLKDASQFQTDSDEAVTLFIDKIITCQKPVDNADLLNLVDRQVHRHSYTCCKNTSSKCRFNYPQPPMKQTMILYPLDEDTPEKEIKIRRDNWKSIQGYLDESKEGEDISFDQLLMNLTITEENYLHAISSSINTPTVFLKRNPYELRINNYSPACLCMES